MKTFFRLQGPPSRAIRWCVVLTIVYTALIFLLPAKTEIVALHNLSLLQFKVAILLFSLPTIITWFLAFLGYSKLNKFALAIKGTEQGPHFLKLSQGLMWLAWSLPLTSISDRYLFSQTVIKPDFYAAAIIIANYIAVFLSLVSFLIIGSAVRGITSGKKRNLKSLSNVIFISILTLLGILYSYLILRSLDPSASVYNSDNYYKLPAWIMILTIIIPYMYSWFIGLRATYELTIYAKYVDGVFYKISLMQIVTGLFLVVASFIIYQYLASIWGLPYHIIFTPKLASIIAIRVTGGIGFLFITIGAYKLRRIEQV